MKYNLAPVILFTFGMLLLGGVYAQGYKTGYADAQPDPELDECAKASNVYRCQYVAEPVRTVLEPPPAD